MNLELKDFQSDAVDGLILRLLQAKAGVALGLKQAVVLSSPTGSGKTVIMAALIEEMIDGSERFQAESPVFLWLSDQPELNEQSRRKLLSSSSRLTETDLIVIEPTFDQELLGEARVYFLNIQKLTSTSALTGKHGDERTFTIWQTLTNTVQRYKGRFYVIIDEAHRGTRATPSDEQSKKTILQKFVLGSEGEIPPMDIIIGMSATPKRFFDLLQSQTDRSTQAYEVGIEDIRASGLLKDRILLYHPDKGSETDWTLLAQAARDWDQQRNDWDSYTDQESLAPISPALIIQVEDGDAKHVTRTDLGAVLEVLESTVGPIREEELAHCFHDREWIDIGATKLRKIDASDIQEETKIRAVLFKMALNTGWDCPRAEVMMSFRKAKDHTSIAQLIGRMVRSPLARRIEGREELNSVALYLPHYDRKGLELVISQLKGDPDAVPPTDIDIGSDYVTLHRNSEFALAFGALLGLPNYRLTKVRKLSNARRLMRLSSLLTMVDKLDVKAWDDSKDLVIGTLDAQRAALGVEDEEFHKKIENAGEITVQSVVIEQGTWRELPGQSITVSLDDRNISTLFEQVGSRLGDGLHLYYWEARNDPSDPNRAKLDFIFLLQYQLVWDTLEKTAAERIQQLFEKNKTKIRGLSASHQEEYNKVREIARKPEPLDFVPPADIVVKVDKTPESGFSKYEKHLFIDVIGEFWAKLNSWERPVIAAEIANKSTFAWLRNYDRKPWAFCVDYEYQGQTRPMYPDFLVVQEEEDGFMVHIVEPHSPHLPDSYAKARGLAKFASKHGMSFGRIEVARVKNDRIYRLNLNDGQTRANVLEVDSNAGLDLLFKMGE